MGKKENGLERQIGLFGAVTILVGAVIGSGIFTTPGTVAAAGGSFGPFIIAWILAGASGILCALVYASWRRLCLRQEARTYILRKLLERAEVLCMDGP